MFNLIFPHTKLGRFLTDGHFKWYRGERNGNGMVKAVDEWFADHEDLQERYMNGHSNNFYSVYERLLNGI